MSRQVEARTVPADRPSLGVLGGSVRTVAMRFWLVMALASASLAVPAAAHAAEPAASGVILYYAGGGFNDPDTSLLSLDLAPGSQPTKLVSISDVDGDAFGRAAWSPDASRTVFETYVLSSSSVVVGGSIYVIGADGSNLKRIVATALNSRAGSPTWSPDGSRVAFVLTEEDDAGSNLRSHIYVVDADGSNLTQLTSGSNVYDRRPVWSPDGSKIAFTSATFPLNNEQIYVMDTDGSNRQKLTSFVSGIADAKRPGGKEWSPDGSKIAFHVIQFAAGQAESAEIYVMNADGSSQVQLTTGPNALQLYPRWSPDGSKIAYGSANSDWSNTQIGVIGADGSNPTQLTNGPNENGGHVWSPDGLKIAFSSRIDSSNSQIGVIGADGTNKVAVTSGPLDTLVDWAEGSVPAGPDPVVGLVDPASGLWYLRNETGQVSSFYYGNPGDVPFTGDWNCDGVDTPGLYRQSDGFAYLRNSNTQGVADVTFFFGNPSDVPLAGDFNGDGCDTLSIYRPSEQRFYIINQLGQDGGGLGAAEYSFIFGNPGDTPVVGDWDGDGVDEIGLYRESSGFFYYRNMLDTGTASGQFYFGNPGDRFIAGDWGIVDGKDTPAVYRGSSLTFYFGHTLTEGAADGQFTWSGAGSGWLPVAGDFGL